MFCLPFPSKQCLLYALRWQPAFSRYEPPREYGEDCYDTHDDRCVIESGSLDWEDVRREKHRHNPPIPQYSNGLEWLAQSTQAPCRLWELLGCQKETAKADQAVGRGGGNTRCRHERGESDRRWENRACDQGGNSPHDKDGVPGLSVDNLRYPG